MTIHRDRDATRARLLDAARAEFASAGFDGTSVRRIAGMAGVDAALIFRYFGSKEGLFVAATAAADPAELLDLSQPELAVGLLRMLAFPPGASPLSALLRSADRGKGEQRLQATICDPYIAALAGDPDGPEAVMRAEMIVATILGVALMRGMMPGTRLSVAKPADVEAWFARCLEALTAPTVSSAAEPGVLWNP